MIDHIGIGCGNFAASRQFYEAALAPLGIAKMMEMTPEMTGGIHGIGMGAAGHPFFWFSSGGVRGSGMHVAFAARTRGEVDAFYAAAMANGGRDNGPPGIRAHYHPTYYGAFVFDPDGINVEAVCHLPE
jgi:catechol 2,3-dioxygenase-like lactoylglutathione lyase family enzyme